MKRLISALLVISMLLSCMVTTAFATDSAVAEVVGIEEETRVLIDATDDGWNTNGEKLEDTFLYHLASEFLLDRSNFLYIHHDSSHILFLQFQTYSHI